MAKLTSTDVYGTLNVQGDTSVEGALNIENSNPQLTLKDTTDSDDISIFLKNSGNATTGSITTFNNQLNINSYFTNGLNIDAAKTIISSGNVGIGTTSPSQKLDVNGNVNISGYLVATSNLVTNNNIYLNYDNSPAGADATIYFGDDASDTAHYMQFDNSAQKFNFSNDILVNGSPIGGGGAASLTQVYDNTTGTTSLVLDSGTVKSGSGILNNEASLSPSTNDATIDEGLYIINTMDAANAKDAYNTALIHLFDNTSFSSVPGANITITGNGTYVASGLAFWGVGAGANSGTDLIATQNGIRIGLRVVVTNWNPLGDSYNYQWQVYVQGFFGDSDNYITSVYTL